MSIGHKIKYYLSSFIAAFKAKKVIPVIETIDSNEEFKGKVALITGGSGGIGKAISKSLVQSGCKVVLCGTNQEKLNKCVGEMGINCKAIVLNLNDISSFNSIIDEAYNYFGQLDILVNAAGIHNPGRFTSFLTTEKEEFDNIMNINVKGTYFFSQAVAKKMISTKTKGHICIVTSQSSVEPAWSSYRLSKWAEKGLIQGMAQELLKQDIVVNGVAPGPTATAMQGYLKGESIYTDTNPAMRYAMPEEVAETVKLLVSDRGNMIVGDTIYISGGRGIVEIR